MNLGEAPAQDVASRAPCKWIPPAVPSQVVQTNDSELAKNARETLFGGLETTLQALGVALERLAKGVEVCVA